MIRLQPFARAARLASALLLSTSLFAAAQQYAPPSHVYQRAPQATPTGYRQTRFPSNIPTGRAPYNAQAYQTIRQGVVPANSMQPQGEIRGNRPSMQPVGYETEFVNEEIVVPSEGQIVPVPMATNSTYPVEVIEGAYGNGAYVDGGSCDSCGTCSSCTSSGGGICDYAPRSKGCNRTKCPCPSDEALSYYRCNFYGHYPTLWRPWPADFLKYRQVAETNIYDRYRPAPKGMEKAGRTERDKDLDDQLKDLLKEQNRGASGNNENAPNPQGQAPAPQRSAPDLLPDEPQNTTTPAPGEKDGSYRQPRRPNYRQPIRPVSWDR